MKNKHKNLQGTEKLYIMFILYKHKIISMFAYFCDFILMFILIFMSHEKSIQVKTTPAFVDFTPIIISFLIRKRSS